MTIWVYSRSKLIAEALATLLEKAGYTVVVDSARPNDAALAIWDLRGLKQPYPPPEDLPTLALIEGTNLTKAGLLSAGYRGYLSGAEDLETLRRAIAVVLRGELWAERSVLSHLVKAPQAPTLTPREHDVLSLLLQGLSNKQIAQELGIAEKTVKVYVSALLDKLEARSRADLIALHAQQQAFQSHK